MRVVAHFNPLYYAVTAARELSAGTIASATVAYGLLVVGTLTVLVLWWSTGVYRKAAA